MIQATGIVAEYNPFHNGHLYHLHEAKRLTQQPVIVVMSGSIMQRGEPACLDKWLRARLAVLGGADLVVELPAAFSLRSAQYFAQGAVQLLQATGCVTQLACGVESPASDFMALARTISSPCHQQKLRSLLKQGKSYAQACSEVLASAGLNKPNDILALEYCKSLLATDIHPVFIQRRDAGYNSTSLAGNMSSATAIRKALEEASPSWQSAVPEHVRQALLTNNTGYDKQLLWQLISYRLRLLSAQEIVERCQCSEGLENLLKQAVNCNSLAEAVEQCTKKRYSSSRIRRLFMQLLLDVPRSLIEQQEPAYLRVLAFNDTGRNLLKQMKQSASLPIITKIASSYALEQNIALQQLRLELRATDIWSMLQRNSSLNKVGNDFLLSPEYVR